MLIDLYTGEVLSRTSAEQCDALVDVDNLQMITRCVVMPRGCGSCALTPVRENTREGDVREIWRLLWVMRQTKPNKLRKQILATLSKQSMEVAGVGVSVAP